MAVGHQAQVLVGEFAMLNALFDAIVRVRQEKKVINNAVALRLLAASNVLLSNLQPANVADSLSTLDHGPRRSAARR